MMTSGGEKYCWRWREGLAQADRGGEDFVEDDGELPIGGAEIAEGRGEGRGLSGWAFGGGGGWG